MTTAVHARQKLPIEMCGTLPHAKNNIEITLHLARQSQKEDMRGYHNVADALRRKQANRDPKLCLYVILAVIFLWELTL